MRSHCSVYVDAGYLLASAATRVAGTSLRNGIHVDYAPLIDSIVQRAERYSGLSVLRVHWYDSARNGVPDAQQERIGELPRVKLRLGRFGVDGQQKGVDLRIGLDLVAHARNGAAGVFVLVSGDDDLTEAVEEAQVHGVQVAVMAVPNTAGRPHGVSRHLVRASDELTQLAAEDIDTYVTKVDLVRLAKPQGAEPTSAPGTNGAATPSSAPSPRDLAQRARPATPHLPVAPAYSVTTGEPAQAQPAYSSSTGEPSLLQPAYDPDGLDEKIDAVVGNVLTTFRQSASAQDLADMMQGKPSIPRDVDRALLTDLSAALDVYDLSDPIRFRLRDRFWVQAAPEAPSASAEAP